MVAVLHLLLMTWAGVATTAWVAPTLRPTRVLAVGLGVSFAVTLGLSAGLLLFFDPPSLAALPYLLGGVALLSSLALAGQRTPSARLRIDRRSGPTFALAGAVLITSGWANVAGSPAYGANTLFYLTFGSFISRANAPYPALWSYGSTYVLPFMQMKYALVYPTLLWSSGDPLDFLRIGAPVLCVLITTSVSLTAFEFFRAHSPPAPAALFSLLFLIGCLESKFYSIRAETIAWIPAFSFLIILTAALRSKSSRRGPWILGAGLLVTTALLHGIVFIVAVCIGTGLWVSAMLRADARRWALLRSTVVAGLTSAVALVVIYYAAHERHTTGLADSFLEVEASRPAAGTIDPARRFYDLFAYNTPVDTEARIRESPPAVPLSENVSVAFTRPLRTPFRRVSEAHNQVAVGVGLVAALALLVCRHRRSAWPSCRPRGSTWGQLMIGFALIVGALFVLSVILNYRSYGWFPWAVVERRFLTYISTAGAMILVTLVAATGCMWACTRLMRRVVSLLCIAAACLVLGTVPGQDLPREKSRYLAPEFVEIMEYIRSHAEPGDRAVCSWGSMGQMNYLTGIPYDSEGVMPYEVYRLIDRNVRSLERTRAFLESPHASYIADNDIRYVILTWRRRTPGRPWQHAPLHEFEELGSLALINRHFAVVDMTASRAPDARRSPARE